MKKSFLPSLFGVKPVGFIYWLIVLTFNYLLRILNCFNLDWYRSCEACMKTERGGGLFSGFIPGTTINIPYPKVLAFKVEGG